MPLTDFKTLVAAAVFAIVPSGNGLAAEEPKSPESETSKKESAEEGLKKDADGRLSANEYFTMAPFVVPMVQDGEHQKQFTLIVAIELEEEDHRVELRRLSPRMRNEIYELLFKMISFRTIKPRIPGNEVLRSRLIRVAQRVAGDEIVKSIFVHTANVTDIR